MLHAQSAESSHAGPIVHSRLLRAGAFAVIAAAFVFAGGGCVRSIEPVLKDDQLIVDNALAGKWVSDEGKVSAEVQPAGTDKVYKVLYTDDKGKQARLVARLGKIGELTIAEFSPDEPTGDVSDVYWAHLMPVYSFLIIQQTKPQLIITTMSAEWFKKYLDAHPEELKVIKRGSDEVIVSSPTEDLQTFILRHWKDEGALGERQTFARPGDPATKPSTAP